MASFKVFITGSDIYQSLFDGTVLDMTINGNAISISGFNFTLQSGTSPRMATTRDGKHEIHLWNDNPESAGWMLGQAHNNPGIDEKYLYTSLFAVKADWVPANAPLIIPEDQFRHYTTSSFLQEEYEEKISWNYADFAVKTKDDYSGQIKMVRDYNLHPFWQKSFKHHGNCKYTYTLEGARGIQLQDTNKTKFVYGHVRRAPGKAAESRLHPVSVDNSIDPFVAMQPPQGDDDSKG